MPLPVAHALVGASLVAAACPRDEEAPPPAVVAAGALLAVCPDFDYGLNVLFGGGWHHGFTHSVAFALLAGLAVARLFGPRAGALAPALCLAALSHGVLDFLLTGSHGLELLWPLSAERWAARLPNPIDYYWGGSGLTAKGLGLLRISAEELLLFGPACALLVGLSRGAWARAGGRTLRTGLRPARL